MFLEERRSVSIDPTKAQAELVRIRGLLAIQHDPELIRHLTALEAKNREKDRKDAIVWRWRSRVRWLSMGDALSRYFFAQMRVKLAHETLRLMRMEDGTVLTGEDDILGYIAVSYIDIFVRDP